MAQMQNPLANNVFFGQPSAVLSAMKMRLSVVSTQLTREHARKPSEALFSVHGHSLKTECGRDHLSGVFQFLEQITVSVLNDSPFRVFFFHFPGASLLVTSRANDRPQVGLTGVF